MSIWQELQKLETDLGLIANLLGRDRLNVIGVPEKPGYYMYVHPERPLVHIQPESHCREALAIWLVTQFRESIEPLVFNAKAKLEQRFLDREYGPEHCTVETRIFLSGQIEALGKAPLG